MAKWVLSVFISIVLGGTVLFGLRERAHRDSTDRVLAGLTGDLSSLRTSLEELRAEIQALREKPPAPRVTPGPRAASPVPGAEPYGLARTSAPQSAEGTVRSGKKPGGPGAVRRPAGSGEPRGKQQEASDAARQKTDERRKELETLRRGPYGRLNVKVNSMGSLLGLNESQKMAYHVALEKARASYEEARREARSEPAEGAGAALPGAGGRAGPGLESREKLKSLETNLQGELDQSLEGTLDAQQLAVYQQLTASRRSFRSEAPVSLPGAPRGPGAGEGELRPPRIEHR